MLDVSRAHPADFSMTHMRRPDAMFGLSTCT